MGGNKSVKIKGDLNNLCIDLRKSFGAMSNDKQRIPHCELFKNGKQQKNKKRSGDFKKDSPRKQRKKDKTPSNELSENGIANKLERAINKTKELKAKKERELKLLSDKENDLMHLLNEYNAKNIDDKALRLKIKQIAKSFNAQRKEMQKMNKLKRKKQKKVRKKEKKMKRKQKKKKKKKKKKREKKKKKKKKKWNTNDDTKKAPEENGCVGVAFDDNEKDETDDEFVEIDADI